MGTTTKWRKDPGAAVSRADSSMAEIHHIRLAMIKNGSWPHWADDEWHDRAAEAQRRGDVSGPAVRAIETSRALRAAAKRRSSAA